MKQKKPGQNETTTPEPEPKLLDQKMLTYLLLIQVARAAAAAAANDTTTSTMVNVAINGITELRLPDNELTFKGELDSELDDTSNETWKWNWEVPEHPPSLDIEMSGMESRKLHLAKLVAGNYTLQLDVSNERDGRHGQARHHFVVIEQAKVNHPPVAVVADQELTVLPDTKVS